MIENQEEIIGDNELVLDILSKRPEKIAIISEDKLYTSFLDVDYSYEQPFIGDQVGDIVDIISFLEIKKGTVLFGNEEGMSGFEFVDGIKKKISNHNCSF